MQDSDFWDDLEFFPEPVTYPEGRMVSGTVVGLDAGYPRELQVGQPVLAAVVAGATIARACGSLVLSGLRASGGGGGKRGWKGLRKGPEYLVTPLRLRNTHGILCEVEIHGYLARGALEPRDLVRARIRRQKDKDLPPKVEQIANLTTGQVLRPAPPTLWSHLGPAMLLQAVLGGLLAFSLVLCGMAVW
jgi:hypothetical protein